MNREELLNQVRKEYAIVLNAYGDYEERMSEFDGKINLFMRYPFVALWIQVAVTLIGMSFCAIPVFAVTMLLFSKSTLFLVGMLISCVFGFVVFNKYFAGPFKKRGLALGSASYIGKEKKRLANIVVSNLDQHEHEFVVTPQEYRYPFAMETILRMIEQGRANTMAEALNLTDDAIHRGQMEAGLAHAIKTQSDIELLVRTR